MRQNAEQQPLEASQPAPETSEEIVQDITGTVDQIIDFVRSGVEPLIKQFLSYEGALQLGIVVGTLALAWFVKKPGQSLIARMWPKADQAQGFLGSVYRTLTQLVLPLVWVLSLWIGTTALKSFGIGNDFIRVIASLLQAWIIIRVFVTFVSDPIASKLFAAFAWTIAALNILKLLDPTIAALDSVAFEAGASRISLYMVLKSAILLTLLVWFASLLSRFVEARLARQQNISPSVKQLVGQTARIGLLFGASMIALNIVGVDLTALAIFSGAIGVGIGFGLQAIFSNLMAGVILLLERSIKVGDFVELASGVTGEVREINIRSTRVTTNDNVDILVPNSEFINNSVTNWTLRDNYKRTRIPFGVAYGTDKDLVKQAALEAADTLDHMLTGVNAKPPEVWLTEFGDSSLNFELVVWIKPESVKRPSKVNADYTWALETALTKYGIEIPFPQRDLHIRSGSLPMNLTAETRKGSGG